MSSENRGVELSFRPAVTVVQVPRVVSMYSMSEGEIDSLASGNSAVHAGFFGTALGGVIAFGITLVTVEIKVPATFAAFVGLFAVSLLACGYSLVRMIGDIRRAAEELRRIKAQPR